MHSFCLSCLQTWTVSQDGITQCPVCRAAYTLIMADSFNITDSIQFMSENVVWTDFMDYEDPGPVWVEFTPVEARPNVLLSSTYNLRRDIY